LRLVKIVVGFEEAYVADGMRRGVYYISAITVFEP
jgi:hypothetical protein